MQPYYQSCHQWQFDLCTYCCRIQFSTYMSWQILKGQKRCLKRLGKAGVHSWSWLIYGFLIHHCDSMILWRSNISVISSFFLISLFCAHDSQLQHVNSQHSSYKHTNKHNIQRFYSNTPPPPPPNNRALILLSLIIMCLDSLKNSLRWSLENYDEVKEAGHLSKKAH